MNYRHAFHAGNFADCFKHALLLALLAELMRKPAPLFVLDTHAGAGAYDLMGEAERTGEWREGIARLLPPPSALAAYAGLVERLGLYPGSPALIRAVLRPGDLLACCELRADDAAAMRRRFRGDPAVGVHRRDGWEAIRGLLPPPLRRGLVLIDPPYEATDEFARVAAGVREAGARFPGGVVAAWYPIKHRGPVEGLFRSLDGVRDLLALELTLREATDPGRLNGCGLLIRNAPWGFEAAAGPILLALRERLAGAEGGFAALRVADE